MTCREFKHNAASLTLWELWQTQDVQAFAHAEECESCGVWVQQQRNLAASMQTLQARTASLEAGPDVERALLRAFRQVTPAKAASLAAGAEERTVLLRPVATPGSAPFVFRLSRLFEIGSYVALAAAIVVGGVLGVRLLQHRAPVAAGQVQRQTAPQGPVPATQKAAVAGHDLEAKLATASTQDRRTASPHRRVQPTQSPVATAVRVAAPPIARTELQADPDAGYVALMFCDPLSCSGESQVVRMELPASAGQNLQPQMADVVVGYDGLVRAIRIVN